MLENSKYYLKVAKAKAKLKEFETPIEDYPNFPVDSDDLSFSSIYVISKYCEMYLANEGKEERYYNDLTLASEYFDSAFKAKNRQLYDWDFKMSATSAYFLSDNFGSAKAVLLDLNFNEIKNPFAQNIYCLFNFIFNNRIENSGNKWFDELLVELSYYFANGNNKSRIFDELIKHKQQIDNIGGPLDLYYIDILCSSIKKILFLSARDLLPLYSKTDSTIWSSFFAKQTSPKILWPAQQLIGQGGVFSGQDSIIQLPTGVGKTKSIELIIRSAFLSGRANDVLIVAPLRALCSEITIDLIKQFRREPDVTINRISDTLQFDFLFDLDSNKKNILICTPEKISFLFRHELNILSLMDLFIFDEAHMLDDTSRGVNYEILLESIKIYAKKDSQKVLISAVLPNVEDINVWMLNGGGAIVKSNKIKTTEKSNGVISNNTDITFLEDNFSSVEYYVPRVIKKTELKLLPKERTQKWFPEQKSLDYALFLALKFCHKATTVIYVGIVESVNTIIKRAEDLIKRDYIGISELNQVNDSNASAKLCNLIKAHYGINSFQYEGACLGIFSHYNSLENGIKISVEDGLKKDKIKLVVCTSTLAQGVNVPIKYLLISSTRINSQMMMARNFQNLIGRTARSGMHTEGTTIITDPKLFENRNEKAGYYNWKATSELYNPLNSEKCGSRLLSIFEDVKIDYQNFYKGNDSGNKIIEMFVKGKSYCLEQILKFNISNDVKHILIEKVAILEILENNICFYINLEDRDPYEIAHQLCVNSYAYFLANEEKKNLLTDMFKKLTDKIITTEKVKSKNFAKAMVGLEIGNVIFNWLNEKINEFEADFDMFRSNSIELFYEVYSVRNITLLDLTKLIEFWSNGETYLDISNYLSLDIELVEKIANKTIAYEYSFFLGSILDIINTMFEGNDSLCDNIKVFQKKVKYGVSNEFAIKLYENGLEDRYISQQISEIVGINQYGKISDVLKFETEKCMLFLKDMPIIFKNKFDIIVEDAK